MYNISIRIDDDQVMHITIPLAEHARPSKNPKSRNLVVASTEGTLPLVNPDGTIRPERLNCSVWKLDQTPVPTWKVVEEKLARVKAARTSLLDAPPDPRPRR